MQSKNTTRMGSLYQKPQKRLLPQKLQKIAQRLRLMCKSSTCILSIRLCHMMEISILANGRRILGLSCCSQHTMETMRYQVCEHYLEMWTYSQQVPVA